MLLKHAWAEIDLSAILHNLKVIRSLLSQGTKVMGVVKADAYGHGLVEVGKAIEETVDFLGVSSLEEGVRLREAGVKKPILNLLPVLPEEVGEALHWDIGLALTNGWILDALEREAKRQGKAFRVHIKVDTGMGRLGVVAKETVGFVEEVLKRKGILLEGIYTHFASAENDVEFTRHQLEEFKKSIYELTRRGIDIPLKHCANSSALLRFPEAHLDLVRPGLLLYGVSPLEEDLIDLRPAMSVKTRLLQVKSLPAGHGVSYGRTHILKRDSRVGVIPVGYAQGFFRFFSNKGKVLVRGKEAPIIGVVCMDQCVIDLTDNPSAQIGDEVVVMGGVGDKGLGAKDLARMAGIIPYEILLSFGKQLPRFYRR